METLHADKLRKKYPENGHTKQSDVDAVFKRLLKVIDKKNVLKHKKSASDISNHPIFTPVPSPLQLIEVLHVPPYSYGTIDLSKEMNSGLYKNVSRTRPSIGEFSLSVIRGRLLNANYPDDVSEDNDGLFPPFTINPSWGYMYKNLPLDHDEDTLVIISAEATLPADKDLVYFTDPGTLNLERVSVEGNLYNSISARKPDGQLSELYTSRAFLKSVKVNGVSQSDRYENNFTDVTFMFLPAHTKSISVMTMAIVKAELSDDFRSIPATDNDYALALVDLRSKRDADLPIAIRPFTNEFKAPPGGIQMSIKLEVYSFH